MAESELTTAWAERGISIGGSSLQMPLISGAGVALGVWDGEVVLVGMGVFEAGIKVFVAVGVGEGRFALLQET